MTVKPVDVADFVASGRRFEPRGPSIVINGKPQPTDTGAAVDASAQTARSAFAWLGTDEIFAPLPPTKWVVGGLQISPGRPAMFAGYGASAKTLAAQSLCLSVASGIPAWNHFAATPGEVRHLDYEQGKNATLRRYQRLALGHGIHRDRLGQRLKVAVFPQVYLDSDGAADAYASACEGVDLVVLDALRGATPGHDENDSKIRACIDNLARVSEKTGTAFWMLHHAGKPKDGHVDQRTVLRGSSAIFDACGCIFVVTVGKTSKDPRRVSQVKPPAEAEGGPVDDFLLRIEDVLGEDGNPHAGVRVVYEPVAQEDPAARNREALAVDTERLLRVIREKPGSVQQRVVEDAAIQKKRGVELLKLLVAEGRLEAIKGPHGALQYFPAGSK